MRLLNKLAIIFLIILIPVSSYASIVFDGANTIINCGSDASIDDMNLSGTGISGSAWIYARSMGEGPNGRIFFKGNAGGDSGQWRFGLDSGGDLRFVKDCSVTDFTVPSVTGVISTDTWYHVAFTWDGAVGLSTDARIYVNGIEVAYASATIGAVTVRSDAALNLCIGNSQNLLGTFDGFIEDAAVWNKVLSLQEIKQLANSKIKGMPLQISPNSLRGYWPMDDYNERKDATTASSILDRSQYKNHGTPSGPAISKASQILSRQ